MKEDLSLKYYFEETIDSKTKDEILIFLKNNESASIEQDPDWYRINNTSKKTIYFYATQNEKIVCYTNITENKWIAKIHLGPVFSDIEVLKSSLITIKNYYLKKGFAQLEVQLGIETNQNSDELEYTLYKAIPFSQKFDTSNWSTIAIALDPNIDQIFKSFKNNHKGSIKKALKENLSVRTISSAEEIKAFSMLYDKMYRARNLKKNFQDTLEVFSKLNILFLNHKKGIFLAVYNSENLMIGGIVLGMHNKEMYYKYGASDPDFRKLPILHLALFEGIKLAKNLDLKTFNFGGYNHFVNESDQVYAINFFKRSFGGEFIFYPKKMYFRLNKLKLISFNILKFAYHQFNSLRK